MLSLHIFQVIFHQFGIGNPCPDLRLVIPWVVVAPVIVFFLADFTCTVALPLYQGTSGSSRADCG